MELTISIKIDGTEVKDVKTKVKEIIEEKEVKKTEEPIVSEYARWFNDTCKAWTKNPETNLATLKRLESIAMWTLNDRAFKYGRGHLYLNEVYDMLGIDRTKAGMVVGWIYDEKNPIGDNYVSFGIHEERNADFVNGYKNTVLLDFNVDGDIRDYVRGYI